VAAIKKQTSVNVIQAALLILSALTRGQKVRAQKTTAGIIVHFMNGILRPLGLVLLSLNEAINGSKTASINLPEAAMIDMMLSTPNTSNCGTSGINPELDGGR
jgi:hypothetical protein